jgi:HSP20 family protein
MNMRTMNQRCAAPVNQATTGQRAWGRPRMNILRTNEFLELQFAVPGYKKDDFDIRMEGQHLIVAANPTQNAEVKYERKEFGIVPFEHTFKLGDQIEQNEIDARVEDGMLLLKLKVTQPFRREIPVA